MASFGAYSTSDLYGPSVRKVKLGGLAPPIGASPGELRLWLKTNGLLENEASSGRKPTARLAQVGRRANVSARRLPPLQQPRREPLAAAEANVARRPRQDTPACAPAAGPMDIVPRRSERAAPRILAAPVPMEIEVGEDEPESEAVPIDRAQPPTDARPVTEEAAPAVAAVADVAQAGVAVAQAGVASAGATSLVEQPEAGGAEQVEPAEELAEASVAYDEDGFEADEAEPIA